MFILKSQKGSFLKNNNQNNVKPKTNNKVFTCCIPRPILPGVRCDDFAQFLLTYKNINEVYKRVKP